jgi:hypothetical protein
MSLKQDDNGLSRPSVLTGAFRAVRGELYVGGDDSLDDADISQTLHGSRAVTGKAVWSANNAVRQGRDGDEDRRQEREAHEGEMNLLRMMEWDAEMTSVGGVRMTNAEAQSARRAICNDGDRYAKWAVDKGHINRGEEEDFKRTAQRMYDLKEIERRNGGMSNAERREWESVEHSRLGRAVDAAAADYHLGHTREMAAAAGNSAKADNPFPTAPAMNTSFAAAASGSSATPPPQSEAEPQPSVSKPQSTAPAF